jgi:hypothetical protein
MHEGRSLVPMQACGLIGTSLAPFGRVIGSFLCNVQGETLGKSLTACLTRERNLIL